MSGNQSSARELFPVHSAGEPVKIDTSFLNQSKAERGNAVSAIIEIDVPEPSFELQTSRRAHGGAAMTRFKTVSPAAALPSVMEEAAELIAKVSHHTPVALRSAGSFVVELTVAQAQQLADSPLVRRIYGNLPLR